MFIQTIDMSSAISFTLDINIQSSNAHHIRPILPKIVADGDIQQTITINKISSSASKKHLHHKGYQRLEAKQCFLPLTPTIITTPSPITIDIQSKLGIDLFKSIKKVSLLSLESVILKTIDCEMIDLFNQMVKKRIGKILLR